jgi:low temperature requirement protein LtrA
MVEQRQVRRGGGVLRGVRSTGEDDRVTTFELFFDLVYVFAATQVTGYIPDRRRYRARRPGRGGRAGPRRGDRAAGRFYGAALVGGVALYLAGELLFKQRMHSTLSLPRLVAIGVLLAALPAAIALPPLVGLAGSVLILAALIVVETTRYAQSRRSLRDA